MNCFCCAGMLVRASDLPEAHWLRQGDLYCRTCRMTIWREEFIDGWSTERTACPRHRTTTTEGDR